METADIRIKEFKDCTCTEDLKPFCPVGNVPLDSRFCCNEQWCGEAYENYLRHINGGRSRYEDARSVLQQMISGEQVSGEMLRFACEAAVEALDEAIERHKRS